MEQNPVALIVDDEPSVRATVRPMLERHGFTVLEASGVEDAVRTAAAYDGSIDIVIANHKLPDGIGRHAVERLRQERPGVRALRYSGYPHEELLRTGGIAEGVVFIQKPFRVDQFMAKVHEALGWLPERRRTAGDGEG